MDTLKRFGSWLVGLFLALVGVIYYLFQENKSLKFDKKKDETEAKVQTALQDAQAAHKEANDAEEDYRTVRDRYKSEHSGDDFS